MSGIFLCTTGLSFKEIFDQEQIAKFIGSIEIIDYESPVHLTDAHVVAPVTVFLISQKKLITTGMPQRERIIAKTS